MEDGTMQLSIALRKVQKKAKVISGKPPITKPGEWSPASICLETIIINHSKHILTLFNEL